MVVPHGGQFHVAEVVGPVRYLPDKVDEHSAFRRPVRWLKDGKPVPRAQARAALQSRMKVYQTCADASDLIPEIQDALAEIADRSRTPTFRSDLRTRLIREAKAEITSGRMDSYGFEQSWRRSFGHWEHPRFVSSHAHSTRAPTSSPRSRWRTRSTSDSLSKPSTSGRTRRWARTSSTSW